MWLAQPPASLLLDPVFPWGVRPFPPKAQGYQVSDSTSDFLVDR